MRSHDRRCGRVIAAKLSANDRSRGWKLRRQSEFPGPNVIHVRTCRRADVRADDAPKYE